MSPLLELPCWGWRQQHATMLGECIDPSLPKLAGDSRGRGKRGGPLIMGHRRDILGVSSCDWCTCWRSPYRSQWQPATACRKGSSSSWTPCRPAVFVQFNSTSAETRPHLASRGHAAIGDPFTKAAVPKRLAGCSVSGGEEASQLLLYENSSSFIYDSYTANFPHSPTAGYLVEENFFTASVA